MLYRAPPAPAFAARVLADVAELVDARDLGSRDESRGGSSPSARTKRCRKLKKEKNDASKRNPLRGSEA